MGNIVVYTDGACLGNPGPGGYAYSIAGSATNDGVYSAGYAMTTNNRMELLAVIKALQHLNSNMSITIYCDSKYVVEAINAGWLANWQKRGLQYRINGDLWQQLADLLVLFPKLTFVWVKGHSGNTGNEVVDKAANSAAKGTTLLADEGYGVKPDINDEPELYSKQWFADYSYKLAMAEWPLNVNKGE